MNDTTYMAIKWMRLHAQQIGTAILSGTQIPSARLPQMNEYWPIDIHNHECSLERAANQSMTEDDELFNRTNEGKPSQTLDVATLKTTVRYGRMQTWVATPWDDHLQSCSKWPWLGHIQVHGQQVLPLHFQSGDTCNQSHLTTLVCKLENCHLQ